MKPRGYLSIFHQSAFNRIECLVIEDKGEPAIKSIRLRGERVFDFFNLLNVFVDVPFCYQFGSLRGTSSRESVANSVEPINMKMLLSSFYLLSVPIAATAQVQISSVE